MLNFRFAGAPRQAPPPPMSRQTAPRTPPRSIVPRYENLVFFDCVISSKFQIPIHCSQTVCWRIQKVGVTLGEWWWPRCVTCFIEELQFKIYNPLPFLVDISSILENPSSTLDNRVKMFVNFMHFCVRGRWNRCRVNAFFFGIHLALPKSPKLENTSRPHATHLDHHFKTKHASILIN